MSGGVSGGGGGGLDGHLTLTVYSVRRMPS